MTYITSNIGKVIYSKVNSTVPVYPVTAPQGTAFPYLVYEVLTSEEEGVKSAVWVDNITVLLMIYDTTYASVCTKANSVRALLDRMKGTVSSVIVDSCQYVTESDDYDSELQCFIKICEYKFRVKV